MQYLLRMQQVSVSEQKSDFCIFFCKISRIAANRRFQFGFTPGIADARRLPRVFIACEP